MSVLDPVHQALRDVQSTRYAELASSTIVVFEHLLTLDDEIELIWNSPWSISKLFFFINRYYGLFAVIFNNYGLFSTSISDAFCRRFFQWQGWTGLITCMIAEVILQMRIYALYLLNKKVLVLMVALWVLLTAASAVIMGWVLSGLQVSSHPIQSVNFKFCAPGMVPHWFFAFWVPIICFESLLCSLALFRGFQTFRKDGPLFQSGRALVGVLVRDSVFYFICMFATYLTNLLVWASARQTLLEIPIGFTAAMSCVLANRVILNVRRAKREVDESHAALEQQQLPDHLQHSSSRPLYPRHKDTQDKDEADIVFAPTRPSMVARSGGRMSWSMRAISPLSEIEMAQLRSLKADSVSCGHIVL